MIAKVSAVFNGKEFVKEVEIDPAVRWYRFNILTNGDELTDIIPVPLTRKNQRYPLAAY